MSPKERAQDSSSCLSRVPTSRMCMKLHFPGTTSVLMYISKLAAFIFGHPILGMTDCHSSTCHLIMAPYSPLCPVWFALWRDLMSLTCAVFTFIKIHCHGMMSFTFYKQSPSASPSLRMSRQTDRQKWPLQISLYVAGDSAWFLTTLETMSRGPFPLGSSLLLFLNSLQYAQTSLCFSLFEATIPHSLNAFAFIYVVY